MWSFLNGIIYFSQNDSTTDEDDDGDDDDDEEVVTILPEDKSTHIGGNRSAEFHYFKFKSVLISTQVSNFSLDVL